MQFNIEEFKVIRANRSCKTKILEINKPNDYKYHGTNLMFCHKS